jgi:hypothetical protein
MTVDVRPEKPVVESGNDTLTDLLDTLRPRLQELSESSLRELVSTALHDFGDVRVTTYLPILVERRVREEMRHDTRGR